MGGFAPPPMGPRRASSISDLIMRRGDVAARGAARSGMIWGGAINQLGQIAAGAYQQNAERKNEKQRAAILGDAIQNFDSQDPGGWYRGLATKIGPEDALTYFKAMMAVQNFTDKADEENQQRLNETTAGLAKLPYETFAQVYAGVRERADPALRAFGVFDLPVEPTPEFHRQLQQWTTEPGKNVELSAGEGLYSPSGQLIVKNPKSAKAPTGEEAYLQAMYGEGVTPEQRLEGHAAYATSGRAPDSGPQFDDSALVARLSKQWDAATQPARALGRQVMLMQEGMKAARRGDLAAGSQAVLVTFQKILDPTSVVRESEYARSAQGQAVLARIEGAFEQMRKGGAGVPLSELEKYATLADDMVKAASGSYTQAVRGRIERTADRYNIPHELVFESPAPVAGDWSTVIVDGKEVRIRKKP